MRGRFQTIQIVGGFSGSLLLAFSGFLLLPLIVVGAAGELQIGFRTLFAFLLPAGLSLGLGFVFQRLFPRRQAPNSIQAMLICCLAWIFCAALGALPFVIALNSPFLNGFFEAMSGFILLIFAERIFRGGVFSSGLRSLEENLRAVIFQVAAIITTTGFSTRDISGSFFGPAARQLFLLMMVIGGCVGSTSGGFKVLRIAILVKTVRREFFRLRAPLRSISSIVIDGKIIKIDEVPSPTPPPSGEGDDIT